MNSQHREWRPDSWRQFPALQQPDWKNHPKLQEVKDNLRRLPPLVFAGEADDLKKQLQLAAAGKAFVLQGGDCSESTEECKGETIRETLKTILQMAIVLTYAGGKPIVKIGRIAGQYAKPRSSPTETVNGVELPSYRGDMVNLNLPTLEARQPNPENILRCYFHATATLNIIRAFTRGGFASIKNVHKWNRDFVKDTVSGSRFEKFADEIDKAISFLNSIGFDTDTTPQLKEINFFTSHEALVLDYEEMMTRIPQSRNSWYGCSAHMLWIGERTRQLDGAHIEYVSGISNPIGIKISEKYKPDELIKMIDKINPTNESGKIVLITRMGKDKIDAHLPNLVKLIEHEGRSVVWICDPMHGNTFSTPDKVKTRAFDDIFQEISSFFDIHYAEGTVPGGIHIELTGLNVTECVGGGQNLDFSTLNQNYMSSCDPRLNAEQSIELAFRLAEKIRHIPIHHN